MLTIFLDVAPPGPLGMGLGELIIIGGICCLIGLPTIGGGAFAIYYLKKKKKNAEG